MRRTSKEIERDYQYIRMIVNTKPVTSITAIGKELGLSEMQVKTSMEKHPRVAKRIIKQLEENKEELKKKKEESESLKAQEVESKTQPEKEFKEYPKEVTTLLPARREGNKLLLNNFCTSYRNIWVISNNVTVHDQESYELNVGDEVYLATKKPDYMSFAHYRIINLSERDNCELLFSCRIYNSTQIQRLKRKFQPFMIDFNHKYGGVD